MSDSDEIREIDSRLKSYKHDYTMYLRLSVIKLVKQGYTRGEAAEKVHVHRKTAENWVKLYNEYGLEGLEPDYSNCGVNCRLSDDQLEELKMIVTDPDAEFDTQGVRKLIEEKYDVKYSYKQTWFILTKKLGIKLK